MPAGEVGLERAHTEGVGARPWGNLFVNWTQAGQGDL